jgi:hypothetical protein
LVRNITAEGYACGLWSEKLEELLTWKVHHCSRRARILGLQYRITSWPWASIKGPIGAAHRIVLERYYAVKAYLGNPIDLPAPGVSEEGSKISDENKEPILSIIAAIPMRATVHHGTIRRVGCRRTGQKEEEGFCIERATQSDRIHNQDE